MSFVAAVTLSAVFSALFSVAHPVQAATCTAIDLQNVRPEAGTQPRRLVAARLRRQLQRRLSRPWLRRFAALDRQSVDGEGQIDLRVH
ncbi:MAG: hypothetical protein ACXWCN_12445 [Caldimonas sp.]